MAARKSVRGLPEGLNARRIGRLNQPRCQSRLRADDLHELGQLRVRIGQRFADPYDDIRKARQIHHAARYLGCEIAHKLQRGRPLLRSGIGELAFGCCCDIRHILLSLRNRASTRKFGWCPRYPTGVRPVGANLDRRSGRFCRELLNSVRYCLCSVNQTRAPAGYRRCYHRAGVCMGHAAYRTSSWVLAGLIAALVPAGFSRGVAVEQPLSIDLKSSAWTGDLDVMAARRAIRVLVPYSKTLYFVDFGGVQRGISYDFMHAFEDALNKDLGRGDLRIHAVFVPVSRDQLIPMLLAGQGDVVAANLTVTPGTLEAGRLRRAGCHRRQGESSSTGSGAPALHSLDDLAGQQVYVQRSSSYYESLSALNEQFRVRKLAPIKLREAPGHFETEDLLEMANAGLVQIVVADDYLAHFWHRVYPHITVHDDLAVRTAGDIAFCRP